MSCVVVSSDCRALSAEYPCCLLGSVFGVYPYITPHIIPKVPLHKKVVSISFLDLGQSCFSIPQHQKPRQLGFRVEDLNGLGFRFQDLGFRIYGLGFRFQDLGFRT